MKLQRFGSKSKITYEGKEFPGTKPQLASLKIQTRHGSGGFSQNRNLSSLITLFVRLGVIASACLLSAASAGALLRLLFLSARAHKMEVDKSPPKRNAGAVTTLLRQETEWKRHASNTPSANTRAQALDGDSEIANTPICGLITETASRLSK